MLKKLLFLSALVGLGAWWWSCSDCNKPPPQLDLEAWWGPAGMKGKADDSIRPFKIKFEETLIKDLKSRLSSHRPLTPGLEGTSMEYGINTKELDGFLRYWAEEYPFAQREKFLNQFPQFKTNIQGLDIHYIHVKPQVKPGTEVVPLLLMHGWPGSVREFYEAIPLLTQQKTGYDFAIEVIVPSLPGYGFSDAAVRPGLATSEIGVVMRNLMHRLGHKKFYVQGGDWGAAIASIMSTVFPEEILGHHTNAAFVMNSCGFLRMLIGTIFPSYVVEENVADRLYPLGGWFKHMMQESGYFHLQATKPDTVGTALSDTPTGLAAYIIEKFASWTVKNAKEVPKWLSKEGLIDNLMIYWSTNSITTAVRLYSETFSQRHLALKWDSYPTKAPTWAVQAKHEIIFTPKSIIKYKHPNLINVTVLEKGGHFLAFELPKEFSEDVWKALKAFQEWHKEQAVKKEL